MGSKPSREEALALFIPLPIYHNSILNCSVSDKFGLKKAYSSNFEYSIYTFILFIPFAIVHNLIYPSTYPETILAQDILKKMNDDQLKMFSSEILK